MAITPFDHHKIIVRIVIVIAIVLVAEIVHSLVGCALRTSSDVDISTWFRVKLSPTITNRAIGQSRLT
ncbi:MAG: hypothetical protein ACRERV_04475, partial [Methylococcales bacterium]